MAAPQRKAAQKRAPQDHKASVSPAVPRGTKTYKFFTITAEAKARMDERARNTKPIPPFVLDDVDPPIVITAPDDQERILFAAEGFSRVQMGDTGAIMGLLRALCGDSFERVWWLVRKDPGTDRTLALLNALAQHFEDVLGPLIEAGELPGGSAGSSD